MCVSKLVPVSFTLTCLSTRPTSLFTFRFCIRRYDMAFDAKYAHFNLVQALSKLLSSQSAVASLSSHDHEASGHTELC